MLSSKELIRKYSHARVLVHGKKCLAARLDAFGRPQLCRPLTREDIIKTI